MRRTTVRIDEALLNEAKALAAKQGRSLNSVMEDALRQLLNHAADVATRPWVELPVAGTADGDMLDWVEIKELIDQEEVERYLGVCDADA